MANDVLSYRGLLADGAQERILLSTKKGEAGYRITKFEIIPNSPGDNIDSVVKIWKTEPSAATGVIDFSDNRLLAVAWNYNDTYETQNIITFDNEIFNQDIYIQAFDDKSTGSINYYFELERIKLSEHDAMVATIKNIRNNS
jgi:hypothetical protein